MNPYNQFLYYRATSIEFVYRHIHFNFDSIAKKNEVDCFEIITKIECVSHRDYFKNCLILLPFPFQNLLCVENDRLVQGKVDKAFILCNILFLLYNRKHFFFELRSNGKATDTTYHK